MKAIDQLSRGTEWQLKRITVQGNKLTNNGQCKTKDLELWLRDPVDCIHELMANPEFDHMVSYVPERVFADVEGKTRWYDEMWTGDWWWEMQGRLPQGAVVALVILASDKTLLLQFQGDQEVWPIYLSLGNISKDIRCQPSKHATILIAYLPISKLECFMRDTRLVERYLRRMYPVVAAYIADFPEQCLVACCMENRCSKCVVGRNEHGDMRTSPMRNRDSMFKGELGLRAIYSPFWATLPHNNIFSCITPDILHQLHKGVFKDHIVSWCSDIIGEEELDAQFKAMMLYSGLRHFKKGISKRKQWTGADYQELQHVFLSMIAGAVDHKVLTAYRMHTEDTLARMHAGLASFHANKNVFIDLGVQEHFNIPKIHLMMHYNDTIRVLGSADGFNTELPERPHIDFAKRAYRASNRRDYVIQMTTWLRRQESIHIQDAYLRWWGSQHPVNQGSNSLEQDSDASGSDSDSDGTGPGQFCIDLPCQVQRFTMVTGSHGYFVPRTCPFPNSTIQRLLNEHGASLFIPSLEAFLRIHVPSWSHRKLTPQDRVNVYKYLKILSPAQPHINNRKCLFKVRASPVIPATDVRRPPAPAHFDSVLVIEDENEYSGEGLRVGEVRVVFKLPSRLGNFPHPLAYIHWFRPLQSFDEILHSFRLTSSSRQHGPNALVVPVHQVLRPCHLIPWVGRESEV
ncbi:hypothetical protein DFJ58DRAFT_908621 [Suillus subalutaceus]|uniref:uncharacterized protein n=1 Tax=Suillus subalutaceus TaxID=48586 RepID=UPI001B863B92|nr:uncharacterized protein DFJ58DRAFT_908621 [Suillus subalutaceus]KAG1835333.1 hypothetical protein DFJ58DRAFT_908621 [Suillus subalutaceus]